VDEETMGVTVSKKEVHKLTNDGHFKTSSCDTWARWKRNGYLRFWGWKGGYGAYSGPLRGLSVIIPSVRRSLE
jgi:hypothetical protein